MVTDNKNWVERFPYLEKLHHFCEDLHAMPSTKEDFEVFYHKIDNDIPIEELKALINRTYKYLSKDLISKNRYKKILSEKEILSKRDFNKLWKEIERKEKREKETKKLQAELEQKEKRKRREIGTNVFLEWNSEGVKKIRQFENFEKEDIILDAGISLIQHFETKDGIRFYQVKLRDEIVVKEKEDLINFIDKQRNYSFVKKYDLGRFISIILNEEEKSLKIEKMYEAIGVFTDKNDNLVVVYPRMKNIMLQGTNGYQEKIIELNKKKGFDTDGDLIEDYLKIIEFDTLPEEVMLITLGHCITAPFFYVLSDVLDVFPMFFWITPTSMGKTPHFECFYVFLFGTEMQNKDNIESQARLTLMSTAHTPALYMDELDGYIEMILSHLKGQATRMSSRERLTKEQKLIAKETYMSYVGSGNNDDFLSGEGNSAFRDRCLIIKLFKKIPSYEDKVGGFEEIHSKLKKAKILGPFLLEESIKFIENMIEGDIPTKLKLETYFKEKKKKINDYLKTEKIDILSTRRKTIYTLLYIGWEFWDFIFNGKGLKCNILSEYLDYNNNDKFKKLVLLCEEQVFSFSFRELEDIIQFYERNENNEAIFPYNRDKPNFITKFFIDGYDRGARQLGHPTMNHLTKLAEMVTNFLRRKIEIKNKRIKKKIVRGFTFPIDEIREKLGLLESSNSFEECYDLFIDTVGSYFGESEVLKLDDIKKELREKYQEDLLEKLIDKAKKEGKIIEDSGMIVLNV